MGIFSGLAKAGIAKKAWDKFQQWRRSRSRATA